MDSHPDDDVCGRLRQRWRGGLSARRAAGAGRDPRCGGGRERGRGADHAGYTDRRALADAMIRAGVAPG